MINNNDPRIFNTLESINIRYKNEKISPLIKASTINDIISDKGYNTNYNFPNKKYDIDKVEAARHINVAVKDFILDVNLNQESVQALNSDSKEFIFFGFRTCMYIEMPYALEPPLRGYFAFKLPPNFPTMPISKDGIMKYLKGVVTLSVLENITRAANGHSPLTSVFCIEHEDQYEHNQIDAERVATSRGDKNNNVTNKEMRRALKLIGHRNAIIRTAASMTFKFVKVQKAAENEYFLKEISPFSQEGFLSLWSQRRSKANPNPEWSEQLEGQIAEIAKQMNSGMR